MKKQLLIFGIIVSMIITGLSGCIEETNKTQENKTQEIIKINNFQVSPSVINKSETTTLTWDVEGATTVSVNNGIGALSLNGTILIQPSHNTTYTLTATNGTNTINATTTIIVINGTSQFMLVPDITFLKNEVDNTLTVTLISISDISWDNIIITGTATKPIDIINEGDSITNCSGTITISWRGTVLYGTYYFN